MKTEHPPTPVASPGFNRSIGVFLLVLLGIACLRVAMGYVLVPFSMLKTASVVVSILFVAAPILGLYAAARYKWTTPKAFLTLAIGVVVWFGCMKLIGRATPALVASVLTAISQSGLIVWCLAIGTLLALLLKDKNVMLPMAIFLALFDMWMVFAPDGIVQQSVVRGSGEMLAMLGYQVPRPIAAPTGGHVTPLAYVGPADFLFLSMFFVALFKFDMRAKETFRAMVPVLAGYLLIVLLFNQVQLGPIRLGALPALVPIGLTVLIVNRNQFRLNRDEKVVTAVIFVLGTAVVIWRIWFPPPDPPVRTLPPPPGRVRRAPPGQTWTMRQGRSPSEFRIALGNTRRLR